ncbi:hypothetical protein ECE50_009020 [Chitinophaga sp. Mgbs1]|uniref:Uncharacterized protein n=1 Tax=Chitinophaga solisilvae TaxID=1233460 RepID=A0A3S1B2L8_9BACT|nr:hypothetical protein [Chitinophaga solisilvae]
MNTFALGLADIASYAAIPSLIFLVAQYRWRHRAYYPLLMMILADLLLTGSLSAWLSHRRINNLFLTHYWTITELPLWGFFFLTLFRDHSRRQRLVITGMITGVAFAIINMIFIQPPAAFNSNARTVAALIEIFFCLLYFLKYPDTEDTGGFWIVAALLVYNASNMLLFMLSNYLLQLPDKRNFMIAWSVNNILLIVLCLTIIPDYYIRKPTNHGG